ncbi:MAG: DUF2905 domain-containing protein [Bacteroidetes bacterium]|nr:DUF2905 domain-containing protein [Bacteroidota bacterium]
MLKLCRNFKTLFNLEQTGKYIILAGITIVFLGIMVYFFGNKFGWFGNLPGDIRYERENVRIYFPITTMILISLILILLLWLGRRFL